MAAFKVGCVPYVNAIPLVNPFEVWRGTAPVEVVYDVPSALPALLEAQEVDAVLVSVIDGLLQPGRTMAAGVCIGSDGPVESVRLFSKVPFDRIRRLALDRSSMTSNALAQIVLADLFRVEPETGIADPQLDVMLADCDACVLIGDAGMTAAAGDLHVLDLGEAWTRSTGMPFVWAAWIGRDDLAPRLVYHLAYAARDILLGDREAIDSYVRIGSERTGLDPAVVERYYTQTMRYRLDNGMLEGLRGFQRRLLARGVPATFFPRIVEPG